MSQKPYGYTGKLPGAATNQNADLRWNHRREFDNRQRKTILRMKKNRFVRKSLWVSGRFRMHRSTHSFPISHQIYCLLSRKLW